ncbi:YceI family protein [Sphingomonas pituitosa]|uniref:YceI family protein n=1 Tax=Sphingomonas pituitosa TaxID=99597 RepID=UPI000A7FE151|nr:YceI family protein [Sphingomonas pituitosa]
MAGLRERYSGIAILLHWALALLLLFQLGLGWALEDLPRATMFVAFQFHKSVGILILVLSLARLLVRLVVPRPAAEGAPALKLLAGAVHWALYGVMILGPLSGWIIVSTARVKLPTLLFGTIPLPHLPLGPGWNEPAETIHGLIGWLLAGLFVLHVAGALRHHLLRDDLIGRMMPAALARRPALSIAVVVALAACVAAFLAGSWRYQGHAEVPAPSQPVPAPGSTPDIAAAPAPTPEASPALEPSPSPSPTASAAAMPVRSWKVAPGGSLGFRTVYSGEAINGRFTRWTADIQFSPDDLAHSKIAVDVDLASVSSGDGERDDTLKGEDFFAIAAHPRARFTATRIRKQGSGYVADGTLALAGVTRPMPVAFKLTIEGDHAQASGTATVQRLAFGVGKGQWSDPGTIPDAVAVTFRFAADAK